VAWGADGDCGGVVGGAEAAGRVPAPVWTGGLMRAYLRVVMRSWLGAAAARVFRCSSCGGGAKGS